MNDQELCDQLEAINHALTALSESMQRLKRDLHDVEQKQETKINRVEDDIRELKNEVTRIR